MPFGSFAGTKASRATAARSTDLSVPATANLPFLELDVVLAGLQHMARASCPWR
jgi:hypothetical protein